LGDAYCFPAEQPGRADIVIDPVTDKHRLGRRRARPVQRQFEDRRVGFSKPSSKEQRQAEMNGINPHVVSRSVELTD
jgi:hypothetical protein